VALTPAIFYDLIVGMALITAAPLVLGVRKQLRGLYRVAISFYESIGGR
jgi:hypothetical protein